MLISRRLFSVLGLAAAAALAFPLTATAKIVDTEAALTELVIGKADAPVEVIEYASLACPACLHFHENIYPELKTEFIDTGKVKFIYRDFPTNTPALAAAMIARCAGPSRHEGMVDIFFDTQSQWGRAENPLQALTMVARMAGLGPNDVDQCLKNSDLMNGINTQAQKANEEKGVKATPTLFVNGEEVENALEPGVMKKAIEKALKGT
ncbi:MAG: DsbA family protein [Rhodospirillales bacterium]|nr:DsbA family protein [Rhodospirillales bacterium]MBO6787247.1 DsbA family protein [Rhodospirillales bacterium]